MGVGLPPLGSGLGHDGIGQLGPGGGMGFGGVHDVGGMRRK
jgi:hypothetical protein